MFCQYISWVPFPQPFITISSQSFQVPITTSSRPFEPLPTALSFSQCPSFWWCLLELSTSQQQFLFWLKFKPANIYDLPRFRGLTGLSSTQCWLGQQSSRSSAGLDYSRWLTGMAATCGDSLKAGLSWGTGTLGLSLFMPLSFSRLGSSVSSVLVVSSTGQEDLGQVS